MELELHARYREKATGRQVQLTLITPHPNGDVWIAFEKLETGQTFTVPELEFKTNFEAYTD
jgi:hypothetical protein